MNLRLARARGLRGARALGSASLLLLAAIAIGPACARAGDPADDFGASPGAGGGAGKDASISADAGGTSPNGQPGAGGDDNGQGTGSDDGSTVVGDDDGSLPGTGDDGSTGTGSGAPEASTPPNPTYACVTTLASPAPVCDSKHDYCLCTADAQCNSHGATNGGCSSGKCAAGKCTGGQFVDSAGCSVVGPTCNQGVCPTGTKCEGGPASGWNTNANKALCGMSFQCCWCTSDSACPVSGKCINDATQNNCGGAGPCTGSGSDFDGMHCELASPGLPMCSMQ
jgi:hypothetical protein